MARFAAEFRLDPNATRAAVRAGYSPRSATTTAYQLLKNPAVQSALAAAEAKDCDEIERRGEQVLAETARIAFADLRRLFDDAGGLRDLGEIDGDTLAGLAECRIAAGPRCRVLKVRRLDKLGALEMLGRHLGLFDSPHEAARRGESLAEAIARIRKRLGPGNQE